MIRKKFYHLSLEDDVIETTVDETETLEPVERKDIEEIENTIITVENSIEAINDSVNVANDLKEQYTKSKEIMENKESTDEEIEDVAQESQNLLAYSMGKLGISVTEFKNELSKESSNIPREKLQIANEGLSSFFKTIWDKIKAIFKWIWDLIVKAYNKIKQFFTYIKNKLKSMFTKSKESADKAETINDILNEHVDKDEFAELEELLKDVVNDITNNDELNKVLDDLIVNLEDILKNETTSVEDIKTMLQDKFIKPSSVPLDPLFLRLIYNNNTPKYEATLVINELDYLLSDLINTISFNTFKIINIVHDLFYEDERGREHTHNTQNLTLETDLFVDLIIDSTAGMGTEKYNSKVMKEFIKSLRMIYNFTYIVFLEFDLKTGVVTFVHDGKNIKNDEEMLVTINLNDSEFTKQYGNFTNNGDIKLYKEYSDKFNHIVKSGIYERYSNNKNYIKTMENNIFEIQEVNDMFFKDIDIHVGDMTNRIAKRMLMIANIVQKAAKTYNTIYVTTMEGFIDYFNRISSVWLFNNK